MANRFPLIVDSVNENIKELPSGDNLDLTGNDALFGDNDKAIFGGELQIYSDATHARIVENGTGQLKIQGNNMQLLTSDGTSTYLEGNASTSAVTLYHASNSPRLATTSTGIDVTGTVTADGLTIDGGNTLRLNASSATDFFTIIQGGTQAVLTADSPDGAANMLFKTATAGVDTSRMEIASNGDIRFYDTDGTTSSFVYDASAGLTINEAGADRDFRVESSNKSHAIFLDAANNKIGFNSTTSAVGTSDTSLLFRMPQAAGKAVFVHDSGDGGVVISGSGSASQAALMFGNNWTTDDGTGYTEEYRIVMDGADDSLKFNYNANASTAMELASNGFVSIGGDSPLTPLHVKYSAAGELLRLESTDAGAGLGPTVGLYRNSASPAPGDNLGAINFYGEDNVSNITTYAAIESETYGVTNGSEAGRLHFKVAQSASLVSRFYMNFGETVANESSENIDFRVESDGSSNALFVDAGNDRVGIFQGSPSYGLDVNAVANFDDQIRQGRVSKYVHNAGTVTLSGSNPSEAWFKLGTLDNPGQCEILYAMGTSNSEDRGRIHITGTYAMTNLGIEVDQQTYNAHLCKVRLVAVSGGGSDFEVWVSVANSSTFAGNVNVTAQVTMAEGSSSRWTYAMTTGTPGTAVSEVFVSAPQGDKNQKVLGGALTVNGDQHNNNDFIVMSNGNANMLFVDASAEAVIIGNSSEATSDSGLSVAGSVIDNISIQYLGTSGGHASKFQFVDFRGQVNARINNNLQNDSVGAAGAHLEFATAVGGTVSERLKLGGTNQTEAVFNDPGFDYDFRVESDGNTHMLFVDASANTVRFGAVAGGTDSVSIDTGRIVLDKSNDWNIESGNSANGLHFRVRHSNADVGSIQSTASGTTYNTTSDIRLKDNIKTITDGTDKLMAMNPVTHTWKADPEADAVHGFIAQEMIDVIPEAVSGDPDGEEMMSMDYGRITPVLVAALQDAVKEITALKERVAELEAK